MSKPRKRAQPYRRFLNKTVVDAAKPVSRGPKKPGATHRSDRMIWDTKITGFALQVKPSGHKSYILQYRNQTGQIRRLTLGRHGQLTPKQARDLAKIEVGRVAQGRDRVEERQQKRRQTTVAELSERFLKEHVEAKRKPRTAREYRRILEKIVLPRLGDRKIGEVTRRDVVKLHGSLAATPFQANRTLAVLSKLFNTAEKWGLRDEKTNPCLHVEKYPEKRRQRRLTDEELERLGEVLREVEADGTVDADAVAALRLLLFTGCRLREILDLRWENVSFDQGLLWLSDSKTGARPVILNTPALAVLGELRQRRRGEVPSVIPGKGGVVPRNDALKRPWMRIRGLAKLEGLRLHDLRHTYGSVGGDAGFTSIMIARLLGHKQISTAERYVHPGDDPVRRACETVGGELAAKLEGRKAAEVVEFPQKR